LRQRESFEKMPEIEPGDGQRPGASLVPPSRSALLSSTPHIRRRSGEEGRLRMTAATSSGIVKPVIPMYGVMDYR
jgi:hypothetical protein